MKKPTSKICFGCKENKSLTLFFKDTKGKYKRKSRCKECQSKELKLYRKLNPIKARVTDFNAKYKASITTEELESLILKQLKKCNLCKDYLNIWHIDHIVPRIIGGTSKYSNLQILCKYCNLGKHTLSQAEYIKHCVKVANSSLGKTLNAPAPEMQ